MSAAFRGVVVALGVGVWLMRGGKAEAPTVKAARVLKRERAAGVLLPLDELLDAWEREGTHDVEVAPDGGYRTDAAKQASYAADGNSNAVTLAQTPHGRGAGLDVYPVGFVTRIPWEQQPQEIKLKFAAFGSFAEQRGLEWGGRWRGAKFPNGDQPHVEIKGWRSLPFPKEG